MRGLYSNFICVSAVFLLGEFVKTYFVKNYFEHYSSKQVRTICMIENVSEQTYASKPHLCKPAVNL
jgi:hypothetical protein